jgi:EmrB/QacA subfamily drug resistance transporter
VAIALGPTVGGVLIDSYSWHWIFYINIPIGVIGSVAVFYCIPEGKRGRMEAFDFPAAILQFILLLCALCALSISQKTGFTDAYVIFCVICFIASSILFVLVEKKTEQPIVDFTLFKNFLFSINLLTGIISFVAYAGVVLLLPFYLEDILGYGVRKTGLLMTIVPIMLGIISPLSGALADHFGARPITVVGLCVLLVAYYLASSLTEFTTVGGYIMRLIFLGAGMGFFMTPNNSAVMGSVPKERLGITSGMLSVSRTLGQTLGVALIGAFWACRTLYHSNRVNASAQDGTGQVFALHDTFLLVASLIFCALLLSILGMIKEKSGVSGLRCRQAKPDKMAG